VTHKDDEDIDEDEDADDADVGDSDAVTEEVTKMTGYRWKHHVSTTRGRPRVQQ
jgi:hypothetical protein